MSYLSEIEPGTELRDGGVLHRPRLREPIDKGPDRSIVIDISNFKKTVNTLIKPIVYKILMHV